jgi:GT2 family glycosyltransferase
MRPSLAGDNGAGDGNSLSIVIPTRDRSAKLLRLLQSIFDGWLPSDTQVIVSMDRCTDDTEAAVRESFPSVTLVEVPSAGPYALEATSGVPRRGSAITRQVGLDLATGTFLFFVDDDNVLQPDCVRHLMEALTEHPNIGAIAPLSYSDPNLTTVWCAGAIVSRWLMMDHRKKLPLPVDPIDPTLTTSCMYLPNAFMTTRRALKNVPFDWQTFPSAWFEIDWGCRLHQSGYDVRVSIPGQTWHDAGYTGFATRINPVRVMDQSRSRVLARRRFPGLFGGWASFALLTVPGSTLYYSVRFFRQPNRWACFRNYVLGTWKGFTEPLPSPPGQRSGP